MKKSEAISKIKEREHALEVERHEKLRKLELEMEIENRESNRNRARSVTVGTSFGGTTEIMMRSDGGRHIWCVMQPVEVIELIHQLAANVGCHIHIKPRQDFSSWRDWKLTEEEKLHYNGHAPFVNDMADVQQLGANMEKYQEIVKKLKEGDGAKAVDVDKNGTLTNQFINKDGNIHMLGGRGGNAVSIAEAALMMDQMKQSEELKNGKDAVAAQKTVNKRTTKRAARAS